MIHTDKGKLDGWQTTKVSGSYLSKQKGKQHRTFFSEISISIPLHFFFSTLLPPFLPLSSVEIFTLKCVFYISQICLICTALALIVCIFIKAIETASTL